MEFDQVQEDKHDLQEAITKLINNFEAKHRVVVKEVEIFELPKLTSCGRPSQRKAHVIIDF